MSDEINVSIDGEKAFDEADKVVATDFVDGAPTETKVDTVDEERDLTEEELEAYYDSLSDEEIQELRKGWADENYPLPDEFPNQEVLEEWSKKFGRIRVRRVAPGEAYVLRRMSRMEFKQFLNAVEAHKGNAIENKMFQEELMVEICTVFPQITVKDIRGETNPFAPIAAAGTASILSADIQEISNMLAEAIGPIEEL